jgi:hypothetical protein
LYEKTEGKYWTNIKDWLDERVPHCKWFGLICNERGSVTEIRLRNNNLEGRLPMGTVESLVDLAILDLSKNKLAGPMNATAFYKMINLTHMDVSMNDFDGHVDMYFGPATIHADYSRN